MVKIIVPKSLDQVLEARKSTKAAEMKLYADYKEYMRDTARLSETVAFMEDVLDYKDLCERKNPEVSPDVKGQHYQTCLLALVLCYMFRCLHH